MALRIREFSMPVTKEHQSSPLHAEVAKHLGLEPSDIISLSIQKKSLDARKKGHPFYRYQLVIETSDEKTLLTAHPELEVWAGALTENPLQNLNLTNTKFRHPPVIIGSGPAGTFAALTLAKAGVKSLIIERGEPVEDRFRTMNLLRKQGTFSNESNYCFGEGGAGTFSDGKLTCGRNHPLIRFVFSQFVAHGAPEDILYEAHPHIGTDFLMKIALRMRTHLQEKVGTQFQFKKIFEDFRPGGDHARYEVVLSSGEVIPTDHLIVAVGHSARDTYQMLLAKGLAMMPKPFAMGARFEHPQELINQIQYGACELLPAAEYKLAAHVGDRGIWTFCMCPGGYLLPTGAQEGHLAINGMSYHSRKSGFANAAVVVNVRREDYFKGHPLDGMYFQKDIEEKAFKAGGSNYCAPAQRLVDFVKGKKSTGELRSTYLPGLEPGRLDQILPSFIVESLRGALSSYNKKMHGFLANEALVVGVETKTSSPVSMLRGDNLQSTSHPGFFPCGEGAGFAGGIVSAALDGVRVAQAVLSSLESD